MSDPMMALIVEDDEDLSFIFAEALKAAGYETEVVRDGNEVWERLEATMPRVVVLDLHLPHVAGTEILKRIRSTEAMKNMRVVVTTADARLAEQTGRQADLVLIKPISFGLLRDLTSRFGKDRPKIS